MELYWKALIIVPSSFKELSHDRDSFLHDELYRAWKDIVREVSYKF